MKSTPTFKVKVLSCSIKIAITVIGFGLLSNANADTISQSIDATQKNKQTLANNASKMIFHKYPVMPNQGRTSAGRFGEFRSRKGGAGSHNGIDVSKANAKDLDMVAMGSGYIFLYDTSSSGLANQSTTNPLIMQMDTGDRIMYRHTDPQFQKNYGSFNKKRISANQPVARMSNKGCGSCAVHLHIEYGVKAKRGLDVWLNKNIAAIYQNPNIALKQSVRGSAPYIGSPEYKITDPTPYLPADILVTPTSGGKALDNTYVPYLGNTIRTQWNALYSASTGVTLPVGSSINGVAVKQGRKLPALAFSGNVSMDAYGSAQVQVAQMIADGTISPEAASSGTIYANDLAQYAPPRTIFGGTAEDVSFDIGALGATPAELIENIGNGRYSNEKWFAELAEMSMMGLLVERLNMINAHNYLIKELHKQNERLEALLAAYTAAETQRYMGLVEEIYARAENPTVIPEVAQITMDEIISGNVEYSDKQVLEAGQGSPTRSCKAGIPGAFSVVKDGIKRIALKHGFNPNDVAALLAFESGGFNLRADNNAGAYGLSQWTKIGITDIAASDLKARGIPPEIKQTPKLIKNLNVTQQIELLDLYLLKKATQRKKDYNSKTIVGFYALVLGGPYKAPSKEYYRNSNLDIDGNLVVTIQEAVKFPTLVSRLCPYYSDYS